MEGGLLLDVVIREGPTILELLSGENKALLVWRNTAMGSGPGVCRQRGADAYPSLS